MNTPSRMPTWRGEPNVAAEQSPLLDLGRVVSRDSRPTTAYEFVLETLRHGILSGVLPGGFQLNQSQVAKALGVSTTPVREAMRDLASEGLIDFDTYRMASVHMPTVPELEEVYNLRRMLETYAISKVVRLLDEDRLAAATGLQRHMDAETDPARWLLLNAEFHSVLTSSCNSPRLESFLYMLRASVALYVGLAIRKNPQRREESNAEHWELLEACRTRDLDKAMRVTELHMDPAKALAEAQLADR